MMKCSFSIECQLCSSLVTEVVTIGLNTYIYTHIYIHTYIHTWDVSVAEWLGWLAVNCGRIGAIGSSPGNGVNPNL